MPPPPKSKPKKAPRAAVPAPERPSTPEQFESELKSLADKARKHTTRNLVLGQAALYLQALAVIGLLGIARNASQLSLTPVYGAIPASISHMRVVMLSCFAGWAGNLALRRVLPIPTCQLLPIVAAYWPLAHFLLTPYSEQLGYWWGPLINEAVTLAPLAFFSAAFLADVFEDIDLSALPRFITDSAPGTISWGILQLAQGAAQKNLGVLVGKSFVFTRVGLQLALTAAYAVFAPSVYLLLTVPALLHTAFLNTNAMTPTATSMLNSTVQGQNWMLLDRRESITGYISVLENLEQGFRVLRADHSLLGGEWVRVNGKPASEPIYGVFVMLESVRLMEREVPLADEDASALVIGLGVGTASTALTRHGIDTTVVEIDPVVHEFARKYFGMQENNPPAIADAVTYTAELVEEGVKKYDYIIHDVFTGGAEPVSLFTLEFLQGLSHLLKPDGKIAINYAGDFNQLTPKMVYTTIKQVFPSCRIFREMSETKENMERWGNDFANMVIYCHKTPGEITFRQMEPADHLDSVTRSAFLQPKNEVLVDDFLKDYHEGVLVKNKTSKLLGLHRESAIGHWKIMRTVVPPKIWELW